MVRGDKPGRVAAYDVLIPDDETRAAIREGRSLTERDTPPEGSTDMADQIRELQKKGIITDETAESALANHAPRR
jgi:hypothetical protein